MYPLFPYKKRVMMNLRRISNLNFRCYCFIRQHFFPDEFFNFFSSLISCWKKNKGCIGPPLLDISRTLFVYTVTCDHPA
jgi:hypothetical protein